MNVFETLSARGFVSQCTDSEALSHLLINTKQTIYLGVDPTFSSLHIGHIVPLYALAHFLQKGHKVIILIGKATASIGDPSGKTEARKLLADDEIDNNSVLIESQIKKFFDSYKAPFFIIKDNSEWFSSLNYLYFLRTIGRHFSVNRMLTFDTYKTRLKTGLSFLEFNYQLLQSYDFYQLYQNHSCRVQIGGDDQWGNIVSGIDLIRRLGEKDCYGLTCPLIVMRDGRKMGKSEAGTVFLTSHLTSSYDFFQYWRNVDDRDVQRFLLLFTFFPLEECYRLGNVEGTFLNEGKELLAYEVTKKIHGKEEADKALSATRALFTGCEDFLGTLDTVPLVVLQKEAYKDDMTIIDLFLHSGLLNSKGEVKRMIQQGGAYFNNRKITNEKDLFSVLDFINREIILRIGKKRHARILFKDSSTMQQSPEVVVHIDGACSGNPGPGGWATVILYGDTKQPIEFGGSEDLTTNNRMELTAAIEALRYIKENLHHRSSVQVNTDSQYVRSGIISWIETWKKNGWKTSSKNAVKNWDLWEQLDEINKFVRPDWQWVKGHGGNKYNERCDQLAVTYSKKDVETGQLLFDSDTFKKN